MSESGETSDEGEGSEGLLVPMWDEEELIYRCALCGWEIIERECQKPECGEEYLDFVTEEAPDGEPLNVSDPTFHLTDESHLLPTARCTTPILDINPVRLHPETVAYGYEDRLFEYECLLARGATRLMCEMFNLVYSHETGIVLEMKDPQHEDLFDQWAGEAVLSSECESWKIFLGREIHLVDDDVDGTEYVDDFLEQALLFDGDTTVCWSTTEVMPGFWETKAEPGVEEQESGCHDTVDGNAANEDGSNALTLKERVAKDEYESSGIDDESTSTDGLESERDEDVFWGSEGDEYEYDSAGEGEVTEEYETDPSDEEEL
ncbi:hypothetical protein L218DRAFT_881167 [Marasmius fiardii PR-910]|nr:hypothetical protein L218DRAFT_881167 [Marasmius fiardii PR-910]